VNTRCPKCGSVYQLDKETFSRSQGKALCDNCGNIFSALKHKTDEPATQLLSKADAAYDIELEDGGQAEDIAPDLELNLQTEEAPLFEKDSELPFTVPEDLPELEPSGDAALDMQQSLQPRQSAPSPWWQKLLMLLLLCTLLAQLAWFSRAHWLHLPEAEPLCQWIDCSVAQQTDLQAFQVIERQFQAIPDKPGALHLLVRFRNSADFAQPLPQLQLSLFDSGGVLLARRLFTVDEYLIPAPSEGTLAQPQEVFTIELKFEDPGTRASGFSINFL